MKLQTQNRQPIEFRAVILKIAFSAFLFLFLFSLYQVVAYFTERKDGELVNQEIRNEGIQQVEIPEYLPVIGADGSVIDQSYLYPDIAVDFSVIQSKYANVVGWIYCKDTPIHYPVLQYIDNDFYLYRLPDGTSNESGSIFMDCRTI